MAHDVVITWPAYRFIDTGFAQCLSALQVHDAKESHRILDVLGLIGPPRAAANRNFLTRAALKTSAEWVLMIDADMAFPADSLDRILAAADPDERPIVSGLYFGGKPEGPAIPHAYVPGESDTGFRPIDGMDNTRSVWHGVGQVGAVGGGFLLCHRLALEVVGQAYEATGHAWFAETVRDGHDIGEDITFCLRAAACGIPIHVDFDLKLGHIKTGVVDERTHKSFGEQIDAGWTEDELNEDWGSRFYYAGFRTLEQMESEAGEDRSAANAALVERAQAKVDSLLAVDGTKQQR